MQVKFSDSLSTFGDTFCSLPAHRGVFRLDDNSARYYTEEELKDYFATRFNNGQRVFDVAFDKFATEEVDEQWNAEKDKVFEFFREISSTEGFKRGLKEMLD